MKDSICIKGVTFKRINEDLFKEIDPKIYNTFARELCARNIRDFWFETATCVYRDKYIE